MARLGRELAAESARAKRCVDEEPPLTAGWLPALLDPRGVRVLCPRGTVDQDGCDLIARSVAPRLRIGGPRIVLDLSRVSHLDYRGLGGFVRLAAGLRREGGDLRIAGPSGYVQAILRAVGIDTAVLVFATVEEAILSFPHVAAARGAGGEA